MERPTSPSPTDRALRIITILTFIPTVCFMIPYAVLAEKFVEPLCIIPAGLSALFAIATFFVRNQNRWRLSTIVVDATLAVMTFAFLLGTWIDMPTGWSGGYGSGRRLAMVGTYGTFGVMGNFVIHTFFALRNVSHILRDGLHRSCPHCHHDLSTVPFLSSSSPHYHINNNNNDNGQPGPSFRRQIIVGSNQANKEAYHYPLTREEYDEDARPSTDIMSTCPPTERFSAETLRSDQRSSESESSRETAKLVEA